ncbi:hypothetical protein MKY41_13535 [Sporosarcina sp. FSL W7-1349]|uniref:hypothetical protein n=1 Tax=Sporosarcina sp. FSL W7-1349 TaxID=2921561 RepID=UPI0030F8C3EF
MTRDIGILEKLSAVVQGYQHSRKVISGCPKISAFRKSYQRLSKEINITGKLSALVHNYQRSKEIISTCPEISAFLE